MCAWLSDHACYVKDLMVGRRVLQLSVAILQLSVYDKLDLCGILVLLILLWKNDDIGLQTTFARKELAWHKICQSKAHSQGKYS